MTFEIEDACLILFLLVGLFLLGAIIYAGIDNYNINHIRESSCENKGGYIYGSDFCIIDDIAYKIVGLKNNAYRFKLVKIASEDLP